MLIIFFFFSFQIYYLARQRFLSQSAVTFLIRLKLPQNLSINKTNYYVDLKEKLDYQIASHGRLYLPMLQHQQQRQEQQKNQMQVQLI